MVGRPKKKESAVIDKSSFLSYKKLLKPSLLSSPKTTALDYAFIISFKTHIGLLSFVLFLCCLSPVHFLYYCQGYPSKIQRYHILPPLLVLQQLSIACKDNEMKSPRSSILDSCWFTDLPSIRAPTRTHSLILMLQTYCPQNVPGACWAVLAFVPCDLVFSLPCTCFYQLMYH